MFSQSCLREHENMKSRVGCVKVACCRHRKICRLADVDSACRRGLGHVGHRVCDGGDGDGDGGGGGDGDGDGDDD